MLCLDHSRGSEQGKIFHQHQTPTTTFDTIIESIIVSQRQRHSDDVWIGIQRRVTLQGKENQIKAIPALDEEIEPSLVSCRHGATEKFPPSVLVQLQIIVDLCLLSTCWCIHMSSFSMMKVHYVVVDSQHFDKCISSLATSLIASGHNKHGQW